MCQYHRSRRCERMQTLLAPKKEVDRVRPVRTKSLVWKYFEDNKDGVHIFCVLCAEANIDTLQKLTGSNTTGMRNHLQKKHEEEFVNLFIKERQLMSGVRSHTSLVEPDKLIFSKHASGNEAMEVTNETEKSELEYSETELKLDTVNIDEDFLSSEEISLLEGIEVDENEEKKQKYNTIKLEGDIKGKKKVKRGFENKNEEEVKTLKRKVVINILLELIG